MLFILGNITKKKEFIYSYHDVFILSFFSFIHNTHTHTHAHVSNKIEKQFYIKNKAGKQFNHEQLNNKKKIHIR